MPFLSFPIFCPITLQFADSFSVSFIEDHINLSKLIFFFFFPEEALGYDLYLKLKIYLHQKIQHDLPEIRRIVNIP